MKITKHFRRITLEEKEEEPLTIISKKLNKNLSKTRTVAKNRKNSKTH